MAKNSDADLYPTEFDRLIERLGTQGVYFIPEDSFMSHPMLASACGMSHRSVVENVIQEGLLCRKAGHTYIIDGKDMRAWIKAGKRTYGKRSKSCPEGQQSSGSE